MSDTDTLTALVEICGRHRLPSLDTWYLQLQRWFSACDVYQVRLRGETCSRDDMPNLRRVFAAETNWVLFFPADAVLLVFPAAVQENLLRLPLEADDGCNVMCGAKIRFRYYSRLISRRCDGCLFMESRLPLHMLALETGETLQEIVDEAT